MTYVTSTKSIHIRTTLYSLSYRIIHRRHYDRKGGIMWEQLELDLDFAVPATSTPPAITTTTNATPVTTKASV